MAIPRITPAILGWDWTDPIKSLSEAFANAQKWAVERIQDIILNPSDDLVRSRVVAELTLMQNNLAFWLSYWVFGLVLLITVLTVRNGRRLGHAFVVWILISAIAPVWADAVWEMRAFGLNAAEVVSFFEAPDIGTFAPPNIGNPIAGMVFFGTNFSLGLVLASTLAFYEFVIVAFQLWALPAVAISSIGPRSKKFSNIVIALGLTAALFGRPAAIFFLEGAMWMIDTLPFGKTAFGAGVYTMGGILAAFLIQLVLIFVMYHAVVFAQSFGSSLVKGTVATTTKQVLRVDVQKYRERFNPTPTPVHIVSSSVDDVASKEASKQARRERRAAAAQAGATATGHPEVGMALGTIMRK